MGAITTPSGTGKWGNRIADAQRDALKNVLAGMSGCARVRYGLPAIWTMDGTTITAGAVLPNPGSDWHLF